ncbi:MAG: WD40/YVTN/BNR-like repeat-containing protein [Planctomycetota bacterium]|jgi:photosystem II stability/assembly factor-like uncharacterized protein
MKTRILLPVGLAALVLLVGTVPTEAKLKGRFKAVVTDADVSLWGVTVFKGGDVRVCGAEGTFVHSTDGKEWKVKQLHEDASLRIMYWMDKLKGFVFARLAKENVLFTTTNGGRHFVRRKVDVPYPVKGVTFLDSRRGWLVAGSRKEEDGTWRKTTDGGMTWAEHDAEDFRYPARVLNGISAPASERIWAVGSRVLITLVGDAAKAPLYRARAASILYSRNRGGTWVPQDAGNPADVMLNDVDFVDDDNGWVVGDKGFVATTANGGEFWKKIDSGTEARLLAVDAVTKDLVFAVGEDGTAIGTNDGGKTFVKIPTKTDRDLRDCSFADESTGYAVGQSGTILRYSREY